MPLFFGSDRTSLRSITPNTVHFKHKPLAKCSKFCYNIAIRYLKKTHIIDKQYGKKEKTIK